MPVINSVFSPVFKAPITDVNWQPTNLFATSEPGVWYDPSDLTTLFTDSAGTTPVTAPGQTVGKMLDKSGRGNHATQVTLAQRPTYGINPITGTRNLITWSADPTNAAWTKNLVTATVDASVQTPLGSSSVRLNASVGTSNYYPARPNVLGSSVTCWSVVKKGSSATTGNLFKIRNDTSATDILSFSVNYDTLAIAYSIGSTGASVVDLGNGWRLVVATATWTSGNLCRWNAGFASQVCLGTEFIYHSNSQIETGSSATAYQNVLSQYEVTQAGVPSVSYLAFDGVDDGMATGTITPAIDKVQVFAGVRKLSDALRTVVAEMSATIAGNAGVFTLITSSSSGPNYTFSSKGTVQTDNVGSTYTAPITNVVSALGDISGPSNLIRVNGSQVGSVLTTQGTGNYLAYPLYIGRRGGSSLPFSGRLYGLITRFGPNLTTQQITSAETYVNGKTGAY